MVVGDLGDTALQENLEPLARSGSPTSRSVATCSLDHKARMAGRRRAPSRQNGLLVQRVQADETADLVARADLGSVQGRRRGGENVGHLLLASAGTAEPGTANTYLPDPSGPADFLGGRCKSLPAASKRPRFLKPPASQPACSSRCVQSARPRSAGSAARSLRRRPWEKGGRRERRARRRGPDAVHTSVSSSLCVSRSSCATAIDSSSLWPRRTRSDRGPQNPPGRQRKLAICSARDFFLTGLRVPPASRLGRRRKRRPSWRAATASSASVLFRSAYLPANLGQHGIVPRAFRIGSSSRRLAAQRSEAPAAKASIHALHRVHELPGAERGRLLAAAPAGDNLQDIPPSVLGGLLAFRAAARANRISSSQCTTARPAEAVARVPSPAGPGRCRDSSRCGRRH